MFSPRARSSRRPRPALLLVLILPLLLCLGAIQPAAAEEIASPVAETPTTEPTATAQPIDPTAPTPPQPTETPTDPVVPTETQSAGLAEPTPVDPTVTPDDPDEDTPLTITGRMCPEEYAGSDYATDCQEIPPASAWVEFWLMWEDNPIEIDAVDENGVANLTIPGYMVPGSAQLAFQISGYYHSVGSVLGCVDPQGNDVPVRDLALEVTSPGLAIDCTWYLLPDRVEPGDEASTTIYAYYCPAGYEGSNYAAECTTPAVNRWFALVHYAYDTPIGVLGATDETGQVLIENPPPPPGARMRLAQTNHPREEEVPLDPFVAECTWRGGEALPFVYDSTGYAIEYEAETLDSVICNWYNIPAAQEPPTPTVTVEPTTPPADPTATPMDPSAGTTTITGYLCPDGYNGSDYAEDCTTPVSGFYISLTTLESRFPEIQGQADDDGKMVLTNPTEPEAEQIVALFATTMDGPVPDFTASCTWRDGEALEVKRYQDNWGLLNGLRLGVRYDWDPSADYECSWYFTPDSASASPTPTSAVVQLPKTGAGAGSSLLDGQMLVVGALILASSFLVLFRVSLFRRRR